MLRRFSPKVPQRTSGRADRLLWHKAACPGVAVFFHVPVSFPAMTEDVTHLLARLREGETQAWDELLPLVYEELRRLSRGQRRKARPYQTLNTTALVHEAYLKLAVRDEPASFQDRQHFFRVAARAMRDVAVDYARHQQAEKRGGGEARATLDEAIVAGEKRLSEVLAVEDALQRLEKLDARQAQVVELRYFAGFSIPETADILGISPATVKREWAAARAWLYRAMREPT